MSNILADHGFCIPEIHIPKPQIDLSKWAVIACDQHTSNPEFWDALKVHVGKAPSTLHLIHPEAYGPQAIDSTAIHSTMHQYRKEILRSVGRAPIYIRRYQEHGYRSGVLLALDLEKYSLQQKTELPIRTSEKTIKERLPARIAIRKHAPLDLSHVLILINDLQGNLIEGLAHHTEQLLYDFTLSMGAGRISGATVSDAGIAHLEKAFQTLYENNATFSIVGDGNHYLAAAKQIWEEEKQINGNHPTRNAMVELVNIHDPQLVFKPIHRIVSGISSDHLLDLLSERAHFVARENITGTSIPSLQPNETLYVGQAQKGFFTWNVPNAIHCVWEIEKLLETLVQSQPHTKIDYIHGEREALEIAARIGASCILLPPLMRKDIFPAIKQLGVLPKKTFSIGRARDKRHYLEVSPLYT